MPSRAPKWFTATVYVGVGWIAIPYMDGIKSSLGNRGLYMLLIGGLAYTVGAICYATRWPKLRPAVFGYHEVFHALVILGAAVHFAVIYQLIR